MRALSWWLSLGDLEIGNNSVRDKILYRADEFARANADTAMVFGAHFRWDFLPYWDALHWYLHQTADALHERGIKLFDHHSATLTHRYNTQEELQKLMFTFMHHLPLVPSRETAETWQFNGQYLNSWRMLDASTGKAAQIKQYRAEQFCMNNPGFREAYFKYLEKLLSESGIDGLMCDDIIYFGGFYNCSCEYCRKRLDFELPPVQDNTFWGNWSNPDWLNYLEERRRSSGDFIEAVKNALPEKFPLTSCCTTGMYGGNNYTAQSVHEFVRGDNIINLEICGDEPGDTCERLAANSYQAAAAEKYGSQVLAIGYGFFPDSAGHLWALNQMYGISTWFSTLNGRLGLTEEQLSLLPGDAEAVKPFFSFEKEHPELFTGEFAFECAVYFSENTKTDSFFGACEQGATRDFRRVMERLTKMGIAAETIFDFPEDASSCRCIILPSVVILTEQEESAMQKFLESGGTVLRFGPNSLLGMPSSPAEDFASLKWLTLQTFEENTGAGWTEKTKGYFYNPSREPDNLKSMVRQHGTKLPEIHAPGFAVSFRGNCIHLLALEYDIIPHELEKERKQYSHVTLIQRAIPVQHSDFIVCGADIKNIYCPIGGTAVPENGIVQLSDDPMYVIIETTQNFTNGN